MAEIFDADFEKYIVFHRSVSRIGYDNNGALCVYYQDGEIQTLGTPFSEEWQTKIKAAVDAANTFMARKSELSRYLDRAETLFNGFVKVDGINSKTENNKTKYYVAFDDVDGVTFDNESGKYKVITENEIKNIILQIDGVVSDGKGGFEITSANAIKEFRDILGETIGLKYDGNNGKYYIDFASIEGVTKFDGKYKINVNDDDFKNEMMTATSGIIQSINGVSPVMTETGNGFKIDFESYMEEASESDIDSLFSGE